VFTDIKQEIDSPAVHRILFFVAQDNSPAGISEIIHKYQSRNDANFYAWVENGKTLGICGFDIYNDRVRIRIISVDENTRNRGVGSAMVTALQKMYNRDIEADTNDDAVGFYLKIGFDATEYTDETRGKRYSCVLRISQGELIR